MVGIQSATVAHFQTALEDIYGRSEALMDSLSGEDWQREHGDDWTMSDVPFHIAYFDRELVKKPLEAGENLAEGDRVVFDSLESIDAWNAVEFAKRPRRTDDRADARAAGVRAIEHPGSPGCDERGRPRGARLDGPGWLRVASCSGRD